MPPPMHAPVRRDEAMSPKHRANVRRILRTGGGSDPSARACGVELANGRQFRCDVELADGRQFRCGGGDGALLDAVALGRSAT